MTEENVEDDWNADCSDEENYQIDTNSMKDLYDRLSKGEKLELEWKCPGRRSPTPQRGEENSQAKEEVAEDSVTEQKVAAPEFDFDSQSTDSGIVTPRRSANNMKTPRSNQKRVAQLDKIMNDLIRHKKLDEEARKGILKNGSKSPNLKKSAQKPS